MKTLVLTGFLTLAFALGTFAQGSINLDNSTGVNYGVAIDSAGNYYTGTFGIEVWELSGRTSVPAGINGAFCTDAYYTMVNDGFELEATFANQHMSDPGTFSLGEVNMPDVTPAGSQVVIGLAVWTGSAVSWAAGLWSPDARAGVVAFLNPTAYASSGPPAIPANLTGWNSVGDLVMAIPEPSTFALACAGVATLLTLRRRKQRRCCGPVSLENLTHNEST
jgi:hypothetical protein